MNATHLKKLIKNLPEFPNVLGKERYFNSAVLVPLIKKHDEFYMLFQKRAVNIRQGSEICFPGGMFDPDQDNDFKETAIRETIEELGISREKIQVEGQLDTVFASLGATVDSYLALLDIKNTDELSVNPDEVEKMFTIPVRFFMDNPPEKYKVRLEVQPSYVNKKGEHITLLPSRELGLPEAYHKPWGGMHHRVLVYKTDVGIIWGITAEIIYEIIKLMKEL